MNLPERNQSLELTVPDVFLNHRIVHDVGSGNIDSDTLYAIVIL